MGVQMDTIPGASFVMQQILSNKDSVIDRHQYRIIDDRIKYIDMFDLQKPRLMKEDIVKMFAIVAINAV